MCANMARSKREVSIMEVRQAGMMHDDGWLSARPISEAATVMLEQLAESSERKEVDIQYQGAVVACVQES